MKLNNKLLCQPVIIAPKTYHICKNQKCI